jgi:glycosyltransferase involved in cell wall biosynthesis
MKQITFVIPTRNNLEFLELAYHSIRNLSGNHEILILDDASTDDTSKWLENLKDDKLIIHTNPGPERIGIVGMFDKGIELATTKIICAFHADMVAGNNFDINILKHLRKGIVVSGTRIEPPLHPPGPEKIIHDFGSEVKTFEMSKWIENNTSFENEKVTDGIFAPWCMYREDFLSIGGHDKLFAPQSREDSDLFNRFKLNGYEIIQSWDALVYHFTSRGSRYNKLSGGDTGKDSPEWKATNSKNVRNFIRKWGTEVLHNSTLNPIVAPIYNIGFVVHNCNIEHLHMLEPWCSNIFIDNEFVVLDYIDREQQNTLIDLSNKCYVGESYKKKCKNDIIVEFDLKQLTQQDGDMIAKFPWIFNDSGETGKFKLGNFNIEILKLQENQNDNIFIKE